MRRMRPRRIKRFAISFTRRSCLSGELFAEAPDAERKQHHSQDEECEEVRPQRGESAAFEHAATGNVREVMDGINDGDGPQPARHGFNWIQRAGKRGEWWIDE